MYAPARMNTCECMCVWVGSGSRGATASSTCTASASIRLQLIFPHTLSFFFSQRGNERCLTDWLTGWLNDRLTADEGARQNFIKQLCGFSCTHCARSCLPTKPERRSTLSFHLISLVLTSHCCIFWIKRNLLKANPIKSRREISC